MWNAGLFGRPRVGLEGPADTHTLRRAAQHCKQWELEPVAQQGLVLEASQRAAEWAQSDFLDQVHLGWLEELLGS